MKKTVSSSPGAYYFDESKNRYFKLLPNHCNKDDSSFLTPSKAAFIESTNAVKRARSYNESIVLCHWHRQTQGSDFAKVMFENYSLARLSASPPVEIPSRFGGWSTVETLLLPPKKLEPIAIFQNENLEVTIRFLKIQKGIPQDSSSRDPLHSLKLVECHPSARLIGNVIDPSIDTNPYRLIFAQMFGVGRTSSSIVLHDIEHGYNEHLSFGSREIYACSWSKKMQQLGIGSRQTAYCVDPETRAVQTLPTNSQDVLAQSFGSAKSLVRSVLFNGCRNGHVIANDLRASSKAMVLVANRQYHPTSIVSVLCSPTEDHKTIITDKTGNVHLWDLRNIEEPYGSFRRPGKLHGSRYKLSHGGRFLYATCSEKAVEIWCTVTCQLVALVTIDDTAVKSKLKTAALLSDLNVVTDVCTSPALFLGTTDGMCLLR